MDEFAYLRRYSHERVTTRTLDELIGLSQGIAADGQVVQAEAEFLQRWIGQCHDLLDDSLYQILASRLHSMLKDGELDAEERAELLAMLHALTGENGKPKPYRAPTNLPLDDPFPDITFADKGFVFTGVMAYGPRKECQRLVTDRGGLLKGSLSKKVHYLVIGTIASEHWMHSTHGLKIEQAMQLRDAGQPIAIINEDHFITSALR